MNIDFRLKESFVMWWNIFLLTPAATIQLRDNGWAVKDLVLMYIATKKQNLIYIRTIEREHVVTFCLRNKKGFTIVDSIKRFQKYLNDTDKQFFIFSIMDKINYEDSKHHVLYRKIEEILQEHSNLKTVDEFHLYCCNNGIEFNEYEQ